MFDYDLVGFQTDEYLQAFEEYVLVEAGGAQPGDGRLKAFGRTAAGRRLPDRHRRDGLRPHAAAAPAARRMRDLMTAATVFRHLIVGVDRLDYSKGLEERFLGFERFLADNPGHAPRGADAADRPGQPRERRGLSGDPRRGWTRCPAGSTASSPTSTGSRSAM